MANIYLIFVVIQVFVVYYICIYDKIEKIVDHEKYLILLSILIIYIKILLIININN